MAHPVVQPLPGGTVLIAGTRSRWRPDVTHRYRVTLPGGQEIPPGTRVVGRGPDLHFLTPTTWYKLSLTDLSD